MGNAIDKKGDASNQLISRMIRNFLKEGEHRSDEKVKIQIKKGVNINKRDRIVSIMNWVSLIENHVRSF